MKSEECNGLEYELHLIALQWGTRWVNPPKNLNELEIGWVQEDHEVKFMQIGSDLTPSFLLDTEIYRLPSRSMTFCICFEIFAFKIQFER